MPEEHFNYEDFAQNIYEQALDIIPNDISIDDKEYLAKTMKQFSQVAAESIINQYQEYADNIIMFIAQVIAEWTFHKGIDIIRAGVPKELRDDILQRVAFATYQTLDVDIKQGIEQEKLIINIEEAVKKEFKKIIKKLYLNKLISMDIVQKAMKLSNIDSINSIIDSSVNVDLENDFFEFNDEDFDLIEYHVSQEENIPTIEENIQMDEYRKNYFENMIKTEPDNPEGYISLCELERDKNSQKALEYINKAIELDSNNGDAYKLRTYIYEYLGEYNKLIEDYKKIIELEPTYENYDYYIRYLNTYIEGGAQTALKVVEKVFEKFPVNGNLYQLRGAVYYHLQDYDNAIVNYKKAIELSPDNHYWREILKQIEQEKQQNIS